LWRAFLKCRRKIIILLGTLKKDKFWREEKLKTKVKSCHKEKDSVNKKFGDEMKSFDILSPTMKSKVPKRKVSTKMTV
jgi:hypothetical protein